MTTSSAGAAGYQGKQQTWGEHQEVALDEEKLKVALAKEGERVKARAERDERKRGYNSLRGEGEGNDMTPEEMEAYRMKKMRADDPMLKFKDLGDDDDDVLR